MKKQSGSNNRRLAALVVTKQHSKFLPQTLRGRRSTQNGKTVAKRGDTPRIRETIKTAEQHSVSRKTHRDATTELTDNQKNAEAADGRQNDRTHFIRHFMSYLPLQSVPRSPLVFVVVVQNVATSLCLEHRPQCHCVYKSRSFCCFRERH